MSYRIKQILMFDNSSHKEETNVTPLNGRGNAVFSLKWKYKNSEI
jgi:hypothetical protein